MPLIVEPSQSEPRTSERQGSKPRSSLSQPPCSEESLSPPRRCTASAPALVAGLRGHSGTLAQARNLDSRSAVGYGGRSRREREHNSPGPLSRWCVVSALQNPPVF